MDQTSDHEPGDHPPSDDQPIEADRTLSRSPACPRCGYDQRGQVAQWAPDRSPLDGRCVECGLAFEWVDLLGVRRTAPAWSVEHASRVRALPWAVVRTLWAMLQPWRAWSELRMAHPIRRGRLVVLVAGCIGLLIVAISLAQGVATWQATMSWERLTTASTGSALEAALAAAFLPLSRNSWVSYPNAWGAIFMYPTPLEQWGKVALSVGAVLLGTLAVQLATTVAFVVLPVSRRRAKVRWGHVLRAGVYSFGPVFVFILLLAVAITFNVAQTTFGLWMEALLWFMVPGVPIMLYMGWSFATSRYMKMEHAWWIGAAVLTIGLLVPPVILVLVTSGPVISGRHTPGDGPGFTIMMVGLVGVTVILLVVLARRARQVPAGD